jgi:beta-N-acetylhexosaminidase
MVMLQNSGDSAYSDPIKNAISAINAGNTLILFVTDHIDKNSMIDPDRLIDGVTQAVQDDQIKPSLINDNARKVLQLRYNLKTEV